MWFICNHIENDISKKATNLFFCLFTSFPDIKNIYLYSHYIPTGTRLEMSLI